MKSYTKSEVLDIVRESVKEVYQLIDSQYEDLDKITDSDKKETELLDKLKDMLLVTSVEAAIKNKLDKENSNE